MIKTKNIREEKRMEKRKIYKLTPSNEKKITIELSEIDGMLKEFSDNFKGKNKGLKCRDYKLNLMSQTKEYFQGCWQGKLDNCSGLDYSEERNENVYNMGYYRGYRENKSGYLNDVKKTNPNFTHIEV